MSVHTRQKNNIFGKKSNKNALKFSIGLCLVFFNSVAPCSFLQASDKPFFNVGYASESKTVSKSVTGVVKDAAGNPLIGVNVVNKTSGTGTITDVNGIFHVNAEAGETLEFSYIGYSTQTVAITGNVLNVRLQPDSQMLSDVVVIGYGTQRKSDLTGAVTNVSSEDFNTGLVSSPEQEP